MTITNAGNSPALGLALDNYSVGTLAPNGGTTTIEVPIQLSGLAMRNFTRTFSLEYTNTGGQSQNITTNSVELVLSHNSMVIPFIQATTNGTITATNLSTKSLNVTYTIANTGKGTPLTISANQTFPSGVSCTIENKTLGSCSGDTYIPALTNAASQKSEITLTFGQNNYIIQPTVVTAAYQGMQFQYTGGSYAIAAGINVTKSFSPDAAFPEMTSTVMVGLSNVGSLPIYNATVGPQLDAFDSYSTAGSGKTFPVVAPNSTSDLNYTVTITSSVFGAVPGVSVSTVFLFAGAQESFSLGNSTFNIYKPVTAIATSSPSTPEENHDFTLSITIANTAPVSVSDVVYTLTLPTGVTLLSGAPTVGRTVTITLPNMTADSNQTVPLKLSTNTGLTIDTSASHITFKYLGTTLTGIPTSAQITVSVDATTRYTVPIVIAVLIALVAVVYVRRKVGTVANP